MDDPLGSVITLAVIPAQPSIRRRNLSFWQMEPATLDSGLRRNDENIRRTEVSLKLTTRLAADNPQTTPPANPTNPNFNPER